MMSVVPFEPAHVLKLTNLGGQDSLSEFVTEKALHELHRNSASWTVLKDGEPICSGGIIHVNKFRGTLWGLLQKTHARDFLFIHAAVRDRLENVPYRRVEAYVDPDFVPGIRWIKLLGFEMTQAFIPYFFPTGKGASEWVRYY